MSYKLVAVTGCISGVAHTYMAAERLEKLAQQQRWQIKIETQGALGIENRLKAEEIKQASVALLIGEIQLEESERFDRIRCIRLNIHHFLRNPEQIVSVVKKVAVSPQGTSVAME